MNHIFKQFTQSYTHFPSNIWCKWVGFCFQVRRTRRPSQISIGMTPRSGRSCCSCRRAVWNAAMFQTLCGLLRLLLPTCFTFLCYLFTLSDCDSYGNFNFEPIPLCRRRVTAVHLSQFQSNNKKAGEIIQMYTANGFVNGIAINGWNPFHGASRWHGVFSLAA